MRVPTIAADNKLAANPGRPLLVQLGQGTSSAPSQPKRFSAVNINKKFLEKNSTTSGSPSSSSGSTTAKVVGPIFTTKLTSTSPASSASGTGWSRPSSAAPPNTMGSQSPNSNSPLLPTASPNASPGASQLQHASKLVQPQPRAILVQQGALNKDIGAGSNKPAWGNVKSTTLSQRGSIRQNDFPTAAEVAQVATSARIAKLNDSREAAETAAATKQARMEEADTFRGVHLDPNAHHWDEMAEDDDNFLDGVIEFGDGRQYKIESTDTHLELDDIASLKDPASPGLVSKEERFADDFDRSWPRSRTSPTLPMRDIPPASTSVPPPLSPSIPQTHHSPQEASRVLFNERSNRLEPYNNAHRPGVSQHPSKRGGHLDFSVSPTELRSVRDFPLSSPSQNPIQLLQKSGGTDFPPRSRRFSGGSSTAGPSNMHSRDRDSLLRRDVPPSPRATKDGNFIQERGRRTAMGPPLLPPHPTRGHSREGARQLPPHLSPMPPSTALPQGHLSSRDSRFSPASGEPNISPQSARLPSQSPALSHTSAIHISPHAAISSLPQLSAPELDVVRKDVMQSAAARAKQRRQQEEEEREKEKERARRKAAELEEKMKAAEVEKLKMKETQEEIEKQTKAHEDAAITVIEEAIKSVEVSRPASGMVTAFPLQQDSRRTPTSAPGGVPALPHSTGKAESWRNKASPTTVTNAAQQTHPRPSVPSFIPPPSALEQVGSLAGSPEADLEVVDFSDMGKFVGVPAEQQAPSHTALPSRPVASDFFEESLIPSDTHSGSNSVTTWRQNQPQNRGRPSVSGQQSEPILPLRYDIPRSEAQDGSSPESDIIPGISTKGRSPEETYQTALAPAYMGHQRTPRTGGFYKEATMSALDDAMSRIRGALDGMQAGEQNKDARVSLLEANVQTSRSTLSSSSVGRKERWVPPALRPHHFDYDAREVFQVTGIDPPRSPKPAWNSFVINLPSVSRDLEPVNTKQLQLSSKPVHTRWDTLSFEPPVEGMSRRDFSLNDILFRKQTGSYRGKSKFRVVLPQLRPYALGPRVNIPGNPLPLKVNGGGAFGRPTAADGVQTWRKAAQPKLESADVAGAPRGLDTMSRSPPPDTLTSEPSPNITTDMSPPSKTEEFTPARARLQPKMPVGSAVAFYRGSRIDIVEADPKASVNFIVNSELEESRQGTSSPVSSVKAQPNITITPPNAQTPYSNGKSSLQNGVVSSIPAEITSPTQSKSSDDSHDRRPITPPNHIAAPWARSSLNIPMKESPARGPDPEHLKAVWSQTSNRAGLHTTNSLEGIADDLTALPFTLQDVKSEDGETPPPTAPSAPSRMSAHDVTRAFQTVPASSPSTSTSYPSHRTPPIAAPPATRPSNYTYGISHPPNTIRPTYAAYPSPIMGHSPSPGIMYSHPLTTSPVPSRMQVNGHTSLYSQPMWMSMGGAAPQNQASMMRPMTSPYPAQIMPYPHPGTPMYTTQPLPNMQSPLQQNEAQLNRTRSVSMMSPAIPHAQMYGSPVLMHTPVMQVPQNHGYMPVSAGRGQARTENGQISAQQLPQQSNHHPPSHSTYNPVPSSSFVRSTW
ncbi:hypothetical protein BDZ94DRAFT_1381882 [Collybia nuda]|uniref:Uncharacterized protein n=1 Tax=Collybia nuda TaxID=64659 RepID=A0A9P6CFY1_9AGAR|nr:hypothetical protein BDZ94DRAFT_1381882 [Collybia nuda]